MRKNMLRRLGAFGLSAILCMGVLVGCSGTSTQSGTTQASTTQAAVAEAGSTQNNLTGQEVNQEVVGGMTEINIVARQLGTASHPDNATWEVLDANLKGMGIEANIEFYPSTDYASSCATLIAGGDYPDMMEFWSQRYSAQLEEMIEDGILRPLDDLIEQYGPNIQKYRTEDKSTIFRSQKDGKIYAIPCREDYGYDYLLVIRKDWLDALGLEVPETLDEFYEVLKAFKNYDADGDGDTSDTIPLGWSKAFGDPTWLTCSAMGLVKGRWNETDAGEIEYYAVMDEYQKAVDFTRKLYQEGLIEPEYTIIDRDQEHDNMANGMYGAFITYHGWLDPAINAFPLNFSSKNPEGELVAVYPFPDENGVRRTPRTHNTQQMIIFSDTSEEKAIACIKFLDYLYTEEGGNLADLCIEGVDWKLNEDGTKEAIVDSDTMKKDGFDMYCWMGKRTYLSPAASQYTFDVAAEYDSYGVANPVIGILTAAGTEYSSGFSSLVSSSVTSMIVDKDVDIDAAFADMVESWYASGGREWTEQMNEAYKERQ